MSFLKNLFSKPKQERQLSQPTQLLIDDIIEFSDSFSLPENLRAKQFHVEKINSHEFEHNTITEWALLGADNSRVYLSVEQGQQAYIKLSTPIDDGQIEQLFDFDELSQVFEEPGQALLNTTNTDVTAQGWLAEQYQQFVFAKVGYFHRQDLRQISNPSDLKAEAFELYRLRGNDDQFSMDIQVWHDGETDILLNLYRPISDIKDYFPGQ